ncbi:MAG: tryptophan-rich sensory protein [Flavobacterium sp.]|nr:tryptophan-rich sensory protein [Flavobacterium sp.]
MNKYLKILIMVATCLAVGYMSSIATRSGTEEWFPTLVKPWFNPPAWIFSPVWSTLYVMMGIAAGLVWDQIDVKRELVRKALLFFAIQLALNALWSILFFGLRNPLLALIEIVILWLMIYETYVQFGKINRFSGYLFIPYLLWVTFATILNGSLWWLNR